MNSMPLIPAILLLAFLMGCGGNNLSTEEIIAIDVTKHYPEKTFILQDLFDIEYVPLETTNESLTFGYVRAVTDDFIITKNANFRDGDIFFFDREGKLLRKINHKGNAPGEYVFTSHVFFDEKTEELFVSCLATSKIYVYDVTGKFKHSFKFPENESGAVVYKPFYRFGQDILIACDNTVGRRVNGREVHLKQNSIFHLISDKDGSIVDEISIPINKRVSQMVYDPPHVAIVRNDELFPYKDNWLLVDPSSDTIYHYSSDRMLKPFMVRTPSVHAMSPEIFLFPGVITHRYCFVQAVKREYNEEDPYGKLTKMDWVYDSEKKKTFEYVIYNHDFSNKRVVENLTFDILDLCVMNSDEIAFTERLEASDLVEAYHAGKLKGQLKEIASKLTEESNPVILLAKYKNTNV